MKYTTRRSTMNKTAIDDFNQSQNKQNKSELNNDIEKIKSALKDASDEVKGKANEIFSQTLESAKQGSGFIKEKLTHYVEQQPMKAVGWALATGLVAGYFMKRSK